MNSSFSSVCILQSLIHINVTESLSNLSYILWCLCTALLSQPFFSVWDSIYSKGGRDWTPGLVTVLLCRSQTCDTAIPICRISCVHACMLCLPVVVGRVLAGADVMVLGMAILMTLFPVIFWGFFCHHALQHWVWVTAACVHVTLYSTRSPVLEWDCPLSLKWHQHFERQNEIHQDVSSNYWS